jgi:hypothetical protein
VGAGELRERGSVAGGDRVLSESGRAGTGGDDRLSLERDGAGGGAIRRGEAKKTISVETSVPQFDECFVYSV